MSLIKTDTSLGIEVSEANVKISYFTVNRDGHDAETGLPKFSANLYLEFSKNGATYARRDVTVSGLSESETVLGSLYGKLKEIPEFSESSDSIPTYAVPDTEPDSVDDTQRSEEIPEVVTETVAETETEETAE